MSKRQVIILWSIAIALAAVVTVVKLAQKDTSKPATARNPGQTLFDAFPADKVAKIEITGSGKSATLSNDGKTWVVSNRDNYPANVQNVHEFLRTLEELKISQAIEAGLSFAPRFGMDESASDAESRGVTAVFHDAEGKPLAKVSLGKPIESGAENPLMGGRMSVGRYLRNHDDESGFYASNEMFPAVSNDPASWLKDDFIGIEKIQTISLSKKDSTEADWTITRDGEDAGFKLVGGGTDEVTNETNVNPLKSLFSYTRFDDVVPAAEIGSRRAQSGTRTATISTFEGFTYTLTITPATNSGGQYLMSVKVEAQLPTERKKAGEESPEDTKTRDEAFAKRLSQLQEKLTREQGYQGTTYEVSPSTVDTLLKDRADIVTKAIPVQESTTAPVSAPPMLAPNPR